MKAILMGPSSSCFSSNGKSREQDLEFLIEGGDSGFASLSSYQPSKISVLWDKICTTIRRLPHWMMYVAFIAMMALLISLGPIIRGICGTAETKKKVG